MAEPIDTGNKTISGRTIWNDPETGEDYSERSTTFEIEGKHYTMPTVSEDGRQYTDDQIKDYVKKYGPIDYLTGEKLPEFRYREDAMQYAISRSSTRKQKMAEGGDVDQQTEEESLWEKYNPLTGSYRKKTPMSVQMLDAGLDFTPVGTVKGVSDIVNEVQKDDPNYLKAAGLTAVELAAVLPVGGPILKGMLRKGDDVAAAVTKNIDETLDTKTAANITDEDLKAWKDNPSNTTSNDRRKQLKGRDEELMSLATEYQDSLAANGAEASKDLLAKYRAAVDEINPIRPINTMPDLISDTDVVGALGEKTNVLGKKKTGILSVNRQFKQGEVVTSRLDINGYTNHDKWVAAVRTTEDVAEGVSPTAYGKAVYLKNVDMLQPEGLQKKSLRIATGKEKGPHAVMEGEYQQQSPEEIYEYAKSVFDDSLKPDSEWVQIGYNPVRAGYFYDRATGLPLEAAEEVIQIGNLVLGRKVIKGDIETYTFNEGGLAMNNESQMAELFEEGGIADDGMRVDPVSGNEIPPGSMASEVRDDVPAQLSEGEYVVPADVLRFYGVKFFEDLRSEAKQGMMKMEVNGRIGGEPVAAEGQQDMDALTPEEMAVLQEMGMAAGGMVPQQRVGYNEAGLEDGSNATTMAANVATQYGRGSGIDRARGVAPAAVSTVILYSPDGLTSQAFTLPAQQVAHDARIAEGWSATQVEVTTDTSVGSDPNEDYGGPLDSDTGKDKKKFSEMTPTEIQQAYNDNLKARNLLTGMGLINPVFAIAGRITTNLAEKQIVARMDVLNIKPPEDEGFFKSIGNSLKDIFGIEGSEVTTPTGGTTKTDPATITDPNQTVGTESAGNISTAAAIQQAEDKQDVFQTAAAAALDSQSKGQQQAAQIVKESTDQESTSANLQDVNAALENIVSGGSGGFNSGGFISKRSKKKKNK